MLAITCTYVVEKDMTERLGERNKVREAVVKGLAVTATSLSLSNIFAHHNDAESLSYYSLPPIEAWDPTDPISVHAAYELSPDSQFKLEPRIDILPAEYSRSLQESLAHPIVRYAVRMGDVTHVVVRESEGQGEANNPQAHYDARDNASFRVLRALDDNSLVKQVDLQMTDGKGPVEDRVYTNSYAMSVVVVHETAHGLSDEWWSILRAEDTIADNIAMSKIANLQAACTNVNQLLFTHLIESLDQHAPNIPIDTPNCDVGGLGESGSEVAEQLFRCTDEGSMFQSAFDLPYRPNGGHAWANANEAAASTLSTLAFGPEYLKECLQQLPENEERIMKNYINALLDVSFYFRPGLEWLCSLQLVLSIL